MRARAVGYIRVSTEEQAQSGFGLDAQEDAIRKYADAVGLELIAVHADPGVSGTTRPADRPGFAKVLELAADERFSVLLVKRFDRLARSLALAVGTSGELDAQHGVSIRSISEGMDTGSAAGRLIFGVLSALAEQERDTITERTKGGRMQKAGQGGYSCGRIPYGYLSDGKGGLLIDEEPAAVVRRIFAENGAGRTVRAIADGLNADGIPSPRGRRWSGGGVSYVLNNQTYFGRTEVVFITGGVVTHVNRPGSHARIVR
ncbi:recombinase family protein [Methylobacterium sp. J-070]|uniref:recombinase family protein n=1 Tax=Methylobacterium sp. J-070 TaxID=2836650 RepID=UPI001FBA2AE0|nr:recombinase family protein [Methylobacterium sp. J-070]MCJ2054008.1 recombinase family protein [Methylobacterium sp. J-070]